RNAGDGVPYREMLRIRRTWRLDFGAAARAGAKKNSNPFLPGLCPGKNSSRGAIVPSHAGRNCAAQPSRMQDPAKRSCIEITKRRIGKLTGPAFRERESI
ncbi:MAG: hypothetical protein IJF88_09160, partial [Oscillospiraceae bacterium]|nr:hypothetical protein [Oscillospiraceae bacterium]